MSNNLKHVVHRRTHLERPQPKARKSHGLLEKKKDYVQRARNYHQKEDRIKKLHEKAYFKNEDEFAFSMVNHSIINGKMRKNDHHHLTHAEVALADSQDVGYIGMREQIDKKSIEKRMQSLHFLDADRPNKHTVFLDDDELEASAGSKGGGASASSATPQASGGGVAKPRKLRDVDVAAYFDTHPALLGKKGNRLRMSQLETGSFATRNGARLDADKRQAYRELSHVQERARKLGRVREELVLRHTLRQKGKRKKMVNKDKDKPAMYRWSTERKR